MSSIWSIRTCLGLHLIKYNVLKEENDYYIIQDTTCSGHKNCEIKISKDFRYIEPINDSAKEYEYFHSDSRYFSSEKEACELFYNEAKMRCNESLERSTNVVSNIESFLKYSKSKRYNKVGGVSYDSNIYTFNKDIRDIEINILNNEYDDYNSLLDNYIFEYKINSFKHIHSILNGKETVEKHYYVDMRKNEDDMSAVYIEVLVKDDKLKIEAQSESCYEWGEYDHNYYDGEKFEDGATTKNNCRYLIIKNLEIGLKNILSDHKNSVKKLTEKIEEYNIKIESLNNLL